MIEKRRDKKGRVLRNGECQRKDGLYQYDYVDLNGKAKCLYSWKLEPGDPLPQGKRKCKSLREKEREVQRNIDDGIVPYGGQLTVLALTKKYILQKKGVRESTRAGYKTVTNILEKEEFGAKRIDKVKLSDAKEWMIKLQDQDGRSYSSIHTIRGVLRPAFQMAVDDDLLRKNPFQFELVSVIVNDSVTRDAITHDEKRKFLEFVRNDKHFSRYYDAIYILFHTGLRISEFCGLIKEDIDFKEGRLRVERQLQRTRDMQYIIEDTKTPSGVGFVPMTQEVMDCFRHILENREKLKAEPVVSDAKGRLCHGFLFLDKNGRPMVALHWEKYMQHIREKYNKIYKVQMPDVTPHVCRHTFCSNMANSGMNPKTLQYIMGHSDIGVTLNTYTHIGYEDASREMKKVSNA